MPNSSAPVVQVERRRSATAAPHGLKRSSWFILVNSNKRRAQLSPEGEANFAGAVEGFTRNLPRFVRFTAGDGASWTKDHIKSVSINYALEKGESAGSLHAHMLLKLEHTTKVQLIYKELWAYFREQGVHGYINCKLCHLGGGIDSIKAYIYKGQAGGRPAVGEEGG